MAVQMDSHVLQFAGFRPRDKLGLLYRFGVDSDQKAITDSIDREKIIVKYLSDLDMGKEKKAAYKKFGAWSVCYLYHNEIFHFIVYDKEYPVANLQKMLPAVVGSFCEKVDIKKANASSVDYEFSDLMMPVIQEALKKFDLVPLQSVTNVDVGKKAECTTPGQCGSQEEESPVSLDLACPNCDGGTK